jgi:guanylate kinase
LTTKSLIVLSAPSGAGKTTITHRILENHPSRVMFSVSATTRAQRPGERDGVDYYFLEKPQFEKLISEGAFIEHEEIFGNYYGTPSSECDRARQMGKKLIFDIDVKGGLSVKKKFPEDTLLIFIAPPDFATLERRLRARQTEPEEVIQRRLERAGMELAMQTQYDHVVINDDLDRAVAEVDRLIFVD